MRSRKAIPALPLEPKPLSALAWLLLRLLDAEAGAGWTWNGFLAHLGQQLDQRSERISAALFELAEHRLIVAERPRAKKGGAEGRLVITFTATGRLLFRAFMQQILRGSRPAPAFPRCPAEGLGRARCELPMGHAGHHVDGGHPALRRGEILSWDGVSQ